MSIKGKDLELVIKRYWCERFGLDLEDWGRSCTRVRGDEIFADTPEIYLYRLGRMALARLDPAKLDWVDWPTDMDSRFIDAEGLMAWAGKGHSISPAGAGLNLYLDPDGFLPAPAVPGIELRRLDAKADWELIKGLLDACSEEEVDDAEIYEDDPDAEVFGGFAEGRLVGYAGFRYWEEKFADIGILCNPEFRQRGLGKCLVSALSEWCLDNDVVPMYRVDPANTGSRRIAEALGFTMWVRIDVLNFVDRDGS